MDKKEDKDFITPDIAKLTERLAENPKSKLFLPLGEEYMKCNLLDEAITVLEDGLKVYPSYLSARVLLGKVYLKKGMVESAKSLFQDVIEKNYDNILAHKQLINIFRNEGNREKALLSCRAVLSINPDDMEIKSILEELDMEIDGLTAEEDGSEQDESITTDEEKTEEEEASKVFEIDEDDLSTSNDNYSIEIKESEDNITESEDKDTDTDLSLDEEIPVPPLESSIDSEPLPDRIERNLDLTEEETGDTDTVIEISDNEEETGDEIVTDTLGELYIKQGYYEKGIEIYKKILESEPDNQEVEQKLKEAVRIADLINKGIGEETESQRDTEESENTPPSSPFTKGEKEGLSNEELSKTQKVQSLQRWLENIKRRKDNEL
ncbi:MAG: tetratricopeptide repeat protein [Nitrospirota bacterium]